MEKFSKLKYKTKEENKNNIVFKDKYFDIIRFEEQSVIKDSDCVVVLPYLIEQNKIIIRQEYIKAYKFADGQELHVCLVGGCIEKNETPEDALLRELQEEAGIVVRPNLKIEIGKPFFISKSCSNKCYMSILTLTEADYQEIAPDKSQEHKLDKAIKLDIKYLNSLNISDIVTELMIEKFKKYINI